MITEFLNRIGEAPLLVVGESGIDEYLIGDCRRISPEAPVPIVEIESTHNRLGLAGNVAQNITSLGGKLHLISLCGKDSDSQTLFKMLQEAGVQSFDFIEDSTRPTLRKTRVIAQKQHVVRIDFEKAHTLSATTASEFLTKIKSELGQYKGIILQDYAKGLFNADTVSFIQDAKKKNIPVFVDPNRNTSVHLYQGATLLTPNLAEAQILAGVIPQAARDIGQDDKKLEAIAKILSEKTQAEHVVITCGEYGMVAFSKGGSFHRMPTFAKEVYDVTGAGDTVIAVLSLAYVLGYSLTDCMRFANVAAGIVVGKIGAATLSPEEFTFEFGKLSP